MKKLYYAAIMFPFLLGACNNEPEQQSFPAEAVLSFSHVATTEVATRAGEPDYTGTFKFEMPANDYYESAATGTVSKTGDNWVIADGPIYLTPAKRDLYAWAPEGLAVTNYATELTAQAYDETADAAKDVLYFYKSGVNSSAPNVDVLFEHAYARLSFVLNTEYKGSKKLGGFSVSGLHATGTASLKDGAVSGQTAAADLTLKADGTAEEVFPSKLSALVVPAAGITGGDIKITCKIDGETYPKVPLNGITALEHGKEYVVTLNITGDVMGVSSVKVQNWTSVPSSVDLN